MRTKFPGCILAVLGWLGPGWNGGLAHHSILPFDTDRFEELEGVVSTVRWANPHVRMTLRVENDAGRAEAWDIEGDSANATARRGFARDAVQVGDRVRIAGWPSVRGLNELFMINILLPNGEETVLTDGPFPLRWTEDPQPEVLRADSGLGRSIFRVWGFGRAYRPHLPFQYTEAARASRREWDPLTDMLAIRCIAPGMPNAILNPYPIEFVDEGQRIRLRIEEWEAERVIDMASREIPADAAATPLGYSIGHWEGATLVIETARVEFPYLDDEGTPMSGGVEMVERFTVSEDGAQLEYEISVTDPENLLAPAVWDAAWRWVPGTIIRPFECEPE